MENSIKPIPTYYNGYRFRSRLEARVAVFHDALNANYNYELEGYCMSNGMYYLPDFYLPDLGYYVEVKGCPDNALHDLERVEQFVLEKKTAVIIFQSIPYDPKAKGLFWFPIMYYTARSGGSVQKHYAFYDIGWKSNAFIQDDFYIGQHRCWNYKPYYKAKILSEKEMNDYAFKSIAPISGTIMDDDECPIKDTTNISPIEKALAMARSTRFEHGETPQTNNTTYINGIKYVNGIPF